MAYVRFLAHSAMMQLGALGRWLLCLAVMQKFQDDPHVVYARAIVEKGAKVVCVEDGLPTWVAEVSPERPHAQPVSLSSV